MFHNMVNNDAPQHRGSCTTLLNVPICTQGMQRTWWPEAGTIIVTGPYCHDMKNDYIVWMNAAINFDLQGQIECYATNVATNFDLGHDFDPEFWKSSISFSISQEKIWSNCHETK